MTDRPENPPAFPIAPGRDDDLAAKFIARIDAGDWSLDRCWLWAGAKTPKGYGVFSLSKTKQARAHRFAFALYHGREPNDMVLHRCDNPSCVNPHHLSGGSHGENMRQMAERRRATREERHHKAKLSFNEAAAICLLSASYTTRELAEMFSVHQSTVAAIACGRLWPDAYHMADAMLAERVKGGAA